MTTEKKLHSDLNDVFTSKRRIQGAKKAYVIITPVVEGSSLKD